MYLNNSEAEAVAVTIHCVRNNAPNFVFHYQIACEGLRVELPPGTSPHMAKLIKICMNEDIQYRFNKQCQSQILTPKALKWLAQNLSNCISPNIWPANFPDCYSCNF